MSKFSRRSFLKYLAVAPIVPYVAIKEAAAEIVAKIDFGFTFGKVTTPFGPSFDQVVRDTLKSKAPAIAKNLTTNNTLLLRLQDNKYVQINKESPEVQTARINAEMEARRVARQAKRCSSLNERVKWREEISIINKGNIYYEDYADLETKFRSY